MAHTPLSRLSKYKSITGRTYSHQALKMRGKFVLLDLRHSSNGSCYLMENGFCSGIDAVSDARKFNDLEELEIWENNTKGVSVDYSEVTKK